MSPQQQNAAPVVRAFNTGRLYTVNGQRIAWCVLSTGNVAMYDLDRMIDYVLKFDGHKNDRTVQRAYDEHGQRINNTAPWNREEYAEARELQSALIAAARAVEPVKLAPPREEGPDPLRAWYDTRDELR